MGDFYKVFIDAAAYPHTLPRCVKVEKGDIIFVIHPEGEDVLTVGDSFKNYNAVVNEVLMMPKPWWMFWKKPIVLGYKIMFL